MNHFVEPLLNWYLENKRDLPWRKTFDPYCIWISEIMAQQTRIEVVVDYYNRFIARYPDVKSLAESSEEELFKYWEGLGYYSRARNLHKAAKTIVEKNQGKFPEEYEDILDLPGIGVYTAGAISSIAYNKKIAAVDGNVCRVLARYLLDNRCVNDDSLKKEYKELLEKNYPENARDFTQAIMELGALICTPKNFKCEHCPLNKHCKAFAEGKTDSLPVVKKAKERRIEKMTVFLVECNGKIAINKRESGLLRGLYQYPNVPNHLSEAEVKEIFGTLGTVDIQEKKPQKHVFSHVEWEMRCFKIKVEKEDPRWLFVEKEELLAKYPLPTAFSRFNEE